MDISPLYFTSQSSLLLSLHHHYTTTMLLRLATTTFERLVVDTARTVGLKEARPGIYFLKKLRLRLRLLISNSAALTLAEPKKLHLYSRSDSEVPEDSNLPQDHELRSLNTRRATPVKLSRVSYAIIPNTSSQTSK
jgi:hypothetical protein